MSLEETSLTYYGSQLNLFVLSDHFFCVPFRPLGPENLLLRGARLKNTKEIFGGFLVFVALFIFCNSDVLYCTLL